MANESETVMPTQWAGLSFRNPFVVASGPATRTLSQLVEAEHNGWAGASIKLVIDPEPYINRPPRYRWLTGQSENYHVFTLESRLNTEQGLRLIEQGRKATSDLILFANITHAGTAGQEGWARMARRFEEAGAHAIEINCCCPNMSFNLDALGKDKVRGLQTGASLGTIPEVVAELTRAVKRAVSIPVVVKLTPEGGNIGVVSRAARDAGADAVSGTANRLGVPPLDIYDLDNTIYRLQDGLSLGCLSGPWIRPLALRDVHQMRLANGAECPIIGTGGVVDFEDAVEMCMCGADLVGMCTAVMLRGFGVLGGMMHKLRQYLGQMGKRHLAELRDAACEHLKSAADLVAHPGYAAVDEEQCVGCGQCAKIGHCIAIEMQDDKVVIHRGECVGCSTCVDICPQGAIHMVGA